MATASPDQQNGKGAMTVRGAAFLGVGSMVGAGIFALLGEAGAVAGSAVWLSFLVAGWSRPSRVTPSPSWGAVPVVGGHRHLPPAGVRRRAHHRDHVVAALLRRPDRHRDGVRLVRELRLRLFFDESGAWARCSPRP